MPSGTNSCTSSCLVCLLRFAFAAIVVFPFATEICILGYRFCCVSCCTRKQHNMLPVRRIRLDLLMFCHWLAFLTRAVFFRCRAERCPKQFNVDLICFVSLSCNGNSPRDAWIKPDLLQKQIHTDCISFCMPPEVRKIIVGPVTHTGIGSEPMLHT